MDKQIQEYTPESLVTIFKDELGKKYAEYRAIDDEGRVGAARVPDEKVISALMRAFIDTSAKKATPKGLLPETMISASPSPMYFTSAKKFSFVLQKRGSEPVSYNIWMPPMITVFIGTDFLTFAVKELVREALNEDTKLYQYPVPNLYSNGRLCYGVSERWDPKKQRHSANLDLAINCLFGVAFTAEVHNGYLYNDLATYYDAVKEKSYQLGYRYWCDKLKKDDVNRTLNSFLNG